MGSRAFYTWSECWFFLTHSLPTNWTPGLLQRPFQTRDPTPSSKRGSLTLVEDPSRKSLADADEATLKLLDQELGVIYRTQFGTIQRHQYLARLNPTQCELHAAKFFSATPRPFDGAKFFPISALAGDIGTDESDAEDVTGFTHPVGGGRPEAPVVDMPFGDREAMYAARRTARKARGNTGAPADPDHPGGTSSDGDVYGPWRHDSYGRSPRHRRRVVRTPASDYLATSQLKDALLQQRTWRDLTGKQQFAQASGSIGWKAWKGKLLHAQHHVQITDASVIDWLDDAVTGHAELLWNPWPDAAAADAREAPNALNDALSWLRQQVFGPRHSTSVREWDNLTFRVPIAKVEADKGLTTLTRLSTHSTLR